MKILFSSYAFHPSVGGIESVSAILADEFVAAGHSVELITQTPDSSESEWSFPVTRGPSLRRLAQLLNWSDVLFQNNISLGSLLPALCYGRPTVVVHQTWIRNVHGRFAWNDRIKRALLHRVTNVAVSDAVARGLRVPCEILPNPLRDDLFRIISERNRTKSLVFVGRLVSDKGVDLLLRALFQLKEDNLTPALSIIGQGPEEGNLRGLAATLGIESQVTFLGQKSGEELAQLLNEHQVIVIPSRWAEPFGVVALEGIACGCVPIGSASGGLKEAIGACGLIFPNDDMQALARALEKALTSVDLLENFRAVAPTHLLRFSARKIASAHLRIMERIRR